MVARQVADQRQPPPASMDGDAGGVAGETNGCLCISVAEAGHETGTTAGHVRQRLW